MGRGGALRRENRPLGDGRAFGALGLASRDFGVFNPVSDQRGRNPHQSRVSVALFVLYSNLKG